MKRALYAGSFDPVTNGHIDIIRQAVEVFDELHIGVAVNTKKKYLIEDMELRQKLITLSLDEIGINMRYPQKIKTGFFRGLTVHEARRLGAQTLIRGLRAVSDFDAEFQMTLFNRNLSVELKKVISNPVNTVFFMPEARNFYLSSTAIREISLMGGDVSAFVPPCVANELDRIRELKTGYANPGLTFSK